MANKDNNPTFMKAVIGPDAVGFLTALKKEYVTLDELETIGIVTHKSWMRVKDNDIACPISWYSH